MYQPCFKFSVWPVATEIDQRAFPSWREFDCTALLYGVKQPLDSFSLSIPYKAHLTSEALANGFEQPMGKIALNLNVF